MSSLAVAVIVEVWFGHSDAGTASAPLSDGIGDIATIALLPAFDAASGLAGAPEIADFIAAFTASDGPGGNSRGALIGAEEAATEAFSACSFDHVAGDRSSATGSPPTTHPIAATVLNISAVTHSYLLYISKSPCLAAMRLLNPTSRAASRHGSNCDPYAVRMSFGKWLILKC